MELRRIYRELEFTSLYKEIKVEEEVSGHREAASSRRDRSRSPWA